jgi:cytochrome c-type biogenesis protein CcmH/NrfG
MTADLVDIFYYAQNGDLEPLIEALRREEKKLDPETELRALVYLAIRVLVGRDKKTFTSWKKILDEGTGRHNRSARTRAEAHN